MLRTGFTIAAILVVVALIMWLINNYLPIDSKMKTLINAVIFVVVVAWLVWKYLWPLLPA